MTNKSFTDHLRNETNKVVMDVMSMVYIPFTEAV